MESQAQAAAALQVVVVDNRELAVKDLAAEARMESYYAESRSLLCKYILSQHTHWTWLPSAYLHVAASDDEVTGVGMGENQVNSKDVGKVLIPRSQLPVTGGAYLTSCTWRLLNSALTAVKDTLTNVVYGFAAPASPRTASTSTNHTSNPVLSILFITTSTALVPSHPGQINMDLVGKALLRKCLELRIDSMPRDQDVVLQLVCCDVGGSELEISQASLLEISACLANLSQLLEEDSKANSRGSFKLSMTCIQPTRLGFEELLRTVLSSHAPRVSTRLQLPRDGGQQATVHLSLSAQTLHSADLVAPSLKSAPLSSLLPWHDLGRIEFVGIAPRSSVPAYAFMGGSFLVLPASDGGMVVPDKDLQRACVQENNTSFSALSRLLQQNESLLVLRCLTPDDPSGRGDMVSSFWALVPQAPPGDGGGFSSSSSLVSALDDPTQNALAMSLLRLAPREQLLVDAPLPGLGPLGAEAGGGSGSLSVLEQMQETSDYMQRALFGGASGADRFRPFDPYSCADNLFRSQFNRLNASAAAAAAEAAATAAAAAAAAASTRSNNVGTNQQARPASSVYGQDQGLSSSSSSSSSGRMTPAPAAVSASSRRQGDKSSSHSKGPQLEMQVKHPLLAQPAIPIVSSSTSTAQSRNTKQSKSSSSAVPTSTNTGQSSGRPTMRKATPASKKKAAAVKPRAAGFGLDKGSDQDLFESDNDNDNNNNNNTYNSSHHSNNSGRNNNNEKEDEENDEEDDDDDDDDDFVRAPTGKRAAAGSHSSKPVQHHGKGQGGGVRVKKRRVESDSEG